MALGVAVGVSAFVAVLTVAHADEGATDQIGVYQIYDPGFGKWILDDGNGYWNADGDVVHYFGGPDTVPVVGDWDGTPAPNPCQAVFYAVPTQCVGPTTVYFFDLSTGEITDWEWDLNDNGSTDSTEQNPTYYYDVNGFYTVTLTITGPGCEDTLTWPYYITVTGCGG